ncbi:MAG: hypothetical protein DWP97_13000 [Calditrichaeota bacterium]|nr:MAG: hypothetical protein DWP97_13000 [Calditrichota bacterium]
MKLSNYIVIILISGIFLISAVNTFGFHEGGVANCKGCHIIHDSEDGMDVTPETADGNLYLLKGEQPSDVCLACHATSNGAVFSLDPLNPDPEKGAGNFTFLLEDNINDGPDGITNIIPGFHAGHNIVAPSLGLLADPNNTSAPGGTFVSSELSCTSCHDPHGNTNFRMLYGVGQIQNNTYNFVYPAPDAIGIDFKNSSETNSNHTAYLSGMSEWCANCHGLDYHENNLSDIDHHAPTSFKTGFVNRYNLYNGTNDESGGTAATAYLPEVPFEDPTNSISRTQGPTTGSTIMCLSCHRAHATSSPAAGRWDFNVEFLQQDGVNSNSYPIPNPYDNAQQESLCKKCHMGNFMGTEILNQ